LFHKPTRALLALLLPVIVMIAFSASALAAPGGKVDICHWANHKYVQINVSVNAEPAHLRHGDVLADEYGDCP
jgi:hypothetical protein